MGATNSTERPYILHTPQGSLRGLEARHSSTNKPIYRRYSRIPYAKPPIGPLRWRRPEALPSDWSFNNPAGVSPDGSEGVSPAKIPSPDRRGRPGDFTTFGPICPQPVYDTTSGILVEGSEADAAKAVEVESVQSEDCLYLNIWVPTSEMPEGGWPVVVDLHGGWLQVGNAAQNNGVNDPFDLFAEMTDVPGVPHILVSPTYRLNLFGFLGGKALLSEQAELAGEEEKGAGNYGLQDQRTAIEWVYRNIGMFGRNRKNITIGGLSAGAHSTFYQLFYDSRLPKEKQIIRRVYLLSNGIGVQPRPTASEDLTRQFDELAQCFRIDGPVSATEKLRRLHQVPAEELVRCIPKLKAHTFRATTDGIFIPHNFLESIHDGTFTARLKANGTRIVIGEVPDENRLYRLINPPSSFDDLVGQLCQYYPRHIVTAMVTKMYTMPSPPTASGVEWADIFARVLADCQVHATERGVVKSLLDPPPGTKNGEVLTTIDVFRYRIAWRAPSLDKWLNPELGVCHAADQPIWWYSGWRAGYTDQDKQSVRRFLAPFHEFLKGDGDVVQWGTESMKQIREMGRDGKTRIVEDEDWDRCMGIWDGLWRAHVSTQ